MPWMCGNMRAGPFVVDLGGFGCDEEVVELRVVFEVKFGAAWFAVAEDRGMGCSDAMSRSVSAATIPPIE